MTCLGHETRSKPIVISSINFWAFVLGLCLPSLCLFVVCVLCTSTHLCMCMFAWVTQPWCSQASVIEKVCVLLCSKSAPSLLLLTCVVIWGAFSPCCHISITHMNDFECGPALWRLNQYWLTLTLNQQASVRDKMWCSTVVRVNTEFRCSKL